MFAHGISVCKCCGTMYDVEEPDDGFCDQCPTPDDGTSFEELYLPVIRHVGDCVES
jgi:hypothetical protein